MKCLQVRSSEAAAWGLLYQPIDGFAPEAGTSYELRVERRAVAHPPADASAIQYRLVKVVAKHKAN